MHNKMSARERSLWNISFDGKIIFTSYKSATDDAPDGATVEWSEFWSF